MQNTPRRHLQGVFFFGRAPAAEIFANGTARIYSADVGAKPRRNTLSVMVRGTRNCSR